MHMVICNLLYVYNQRPMAYCMLVCSLCILTILFSFNTLKVLLSTSVLAMCNKNEWDVPFVHKVN